MAYYSDELIEEVRSRNDIVDVISGYVRLTKKAARILDCAPSIMKRPVLFLYHRISRCITALDAEQAEMYLPF